MSAVVDDQNRRIFDHVSYAGIEDNMADDGRIVLEFHFGLPSGSNVLH